MNANRARGTTGPRDHLRGAWDAEGYDERFGYVSALARGVVDLLRPSPGERVLDLGCGTGALASEIASSGAVVWGIDADPAMIEQARAQHDGVTFVQGDGHNFRLEERFDAVFTNAALHWMPRPHEVASSVFDVLRPGGRFVGEFGGERNVQCIIEAAQQAARECGLADGSVSNPWYFPSLPEYAAVLHAAGFVVRHMEHFERPTPLDDCPDGIADWLRMFGDALLSGVAVDLREPVVRRAAELAAPVLLQDGRWFADYRRLRFIAERPHADDQSTTPEGT